ncbi:MAG: hypothetical protein ABIH76_05510, partial [Candidatus Bathyarchaeota archaeon]
MDRKIVTAAILVIIIVLALFGLNALLSNTNENNSGMDNGVKEMFSVDTTGGQFSILQDSVEVNVYSGSVAEQVNITVEQINNPVADSSLYMFSCFEFGPDGLTFEKTIDVIINYNVNDLPEGVKESDIKIYVLTNGVWEPIDGSFANQAMHYAVAKVSHFSKMAGGGPAPSSENTSTNVENESDENETMSQYWFKANLEFYSHKDVRLNERDDDDMYGAGVSAYWDPVPYVQYYQVKFVFNGNPPEEYGLSCEYRDQDKSYCSKSLPYMKEGYIFNLNGDPELEGFLGLLTSGEATATKYDPETGETTKIVYAHIFPEGKHGFNVFGVYDEVLDAEG